MNYQYFVQIVPTDIQTLIGSWPAFQYSVKEQAREVGNYAMGSSGIPGNSCGANIGIRRTTSLFFQDISTLTNNNK